MIPAVGGLIGGPLIYYFAREARGHGVPEVMKAVATRGGVIRARVVFVKAIASAVSISARSSASTTSRMSGVVPLNEKAEVRPATHNRVTFTSAFAISSAMPSQKYSCSGSPDMFSNGSTAMDGLSVTDLCLSDGVLGEMPSIRTR